MKTTFIMSLIFFSFQITQAQENQQTTTWLSFPNKTTLNAPRLIKVQYNIFVDPTGKAPNGAAGRHMGFKMTAIMGGLFVEPSLSTFPQLEDGYTDFVTTVGLNWHMFRTTALRYYTGLRAGIAFREGTHALIGFALGADLSLITLETGQTLYLGAEVFTDYRTDLQDQFYGDSTNYKGGTIFTNSAVRENGIIKLGIRL